MAVLRFALSPCPNDVFLYAGLLLRKVATPGWDLEFHFEDIQTLNQWAVEGGLDVLKISFAQYPRVAKQYHILPCGGALGRGCGPLLLTGGMGFDPRRPVLIPGETTTAHALLNFFAACEWPGLQLQKEFRRFDSLYEALKQDRSAQGVVIHEMRFTYASDGLNLVQDLGAFWEARMHAPIPLGALVLHKERGLSPEILAPWVRASLDWSYAHMDDALALCRRYAQSMELNVMRQHIELYVNAFSRDWGVEGHAAVRQFFSHLGYSFPG